MNAAPSNSIIPRIRLSLVAPSGSGKSTAAGLLKEAFESRGLRVDIIKLAEPLYRIQAFHYQEAQRPLQAGVQDQLLLEQIATTLRRINPTSLVDSFRERLAGSTADVVINDDLRDDAVDWPALCGLGFHVVGIRARLELRRERLDRRKDATTCAESPLDLQIARIPTHDELHNDGSLEKLRDAVNALVERMSAQTHPLVPKDPS